jgi:hypothetical protein
MIRIKECAPISFFLHYFTLGLTFGSLKRFGAPLNTTYQIMEKAKIVSISYNENTSIDNKNLNNIWFHDTLDFQNTNMGRKEL